MASVTLCLCTAILLVISAGCDRVSSDDGWAHVTAGVNHTCALDNDGKAVCWGCRVFDDGDTETEQLETMPGCEGPADPDETFTALDAYGEGATGIAATGEIVAWGVDRCSQWTVDEGLDVVKAVRSVAATSDQSILTQCGEEVHEGPYLDVGTNGGSTCGLRSDGAIECWEESGSEDDTGVRDAPAGVFEQISINGATACGLDNTGAVQCWGCAGSDTRDRGQCTTIEGPFVQVSAGSYHACAVDESGGIECWGDDQYGQASPPSGTFTRVAAGTYHSCGLSDDGHIVCWGCGNTALHRGHNYGQCSPP